MADNMTPQQRSYTMSRVRSKDTAPEMTIRSLVHGMGLRFRKHCADLPGCPDLVFPQRKVAVFVDGDFWHGWRFPAWKNKLPDYWRRKIEANRRRDERNRRRLRRAGWLVIRIWEHEVSQSANDCVATIACAVRRRRPRR